MSEPKPCPWCGETPPVTETDFSAWYIYCSAEACRIHPYTGLHGSRNAVIRTWNTRAVTGGSEE